MIGRGIGNDNAKLRMIEVIHSMKLGLLTILAFYVSAPPLAIGKDRAAQPVKVAVVEDAGYSIGKVRVTFKDGTRAIWSKSRNAGMARIADDGTVGWVNFSDLKPSTYRPGDMERLDGSITICRNGKALCTVRSSRLWIKEWRFVDNGRRFVVGSMLRHGAMTFDLFDSRTGKRIDIYEESDESKKAPEWVAPYRE